MTEWRWTPNEHVDVVDLEKELADVIDADDGLLIDGDPDELASVHWADDDDDGHWLVCTKCSERRLVPRGQFCTFQKGEISCFVQVCASDLFLDKAQAFGLIRLS